MEKSKLNIDDTLYETRITRKYGMRKKYVAPDPSKLFALLPGTIVEICVHEGEKISRGSTILVFEAMKMKNTVKSAIDVKIKKINVKIGEQVPKGCLLVEFAE